EPACSGWWGTPPPAPARPVASAGASGGRMVAGGPGENLLADEQQHERDEQQRAEVIACPRHLILLILVGRMIGDFHGIEPCQKISGRYLREVAFIGIDV